MLYILGPLFIYEDLFSWEINIYGVAMLTHFSVL